MPLPPVPVPQRLQGRSVVVTGAGTGFGAEIAVRAAQEGAPMGRIPGPAELAGTALFLATDDASHMTGGYLVADGGYNMVGA